jgi:isopentenyl diphosphate isomerase/L-lactate dehydrogenase-like FMN-dependent dehydrogenase
MFGVSSLGPAGLQELRTTHDTPQAYQVYFHNDRGLNRAMLQRAKEVGVEVTMLTVDSIIGGHRQRDLRAGFSFHPGSCRGCSNSRSSQCGASTALPTKASNVASWTTTLT